MELMVSISAGKATRKTYSPLRKLSEKEFGRVRAGTAATCLNTTPVDITELFDNA
jgi:hypothetical protein